MLLIIFLAHIALACFTEKGQFPTTTTTTGTQSFSHLDDLLINYEDNMYVTVIAVCYHYFDS